MQHQYSGHTLFTYNWLCLLPILAAVLLVATLHILQLHIDRFAPALMVIGQLLIESLPMFIAQWLCFNMIGKVRLVGWISGLVLYPLTMLLIRSWHLDWMVWSLFSWQLFTFTLVASISYVLNQRLRFSMPSLRFLSFLSLNSVLVILVMGWSILMAGVFISNPDPMLNQLQFEIKLDNLQDNVLGFLHYLWQFMILGMTVLLLYWVNRYLLIRKLLANHGLVMFLVGVGLTVFCLSPLLATIVTWLPLNIPQRSLTPAENYNPFSFYNYNFSFWILTVSTPLILAFERQQKDKTLAQAAAQQIQTELKLLQQQINPHFLFNTLNSLYALTLNQSAQAPNMVMQLANLLRYTVYEGQKSLVTLEQEVNYLKDYIALQKIRYGEKCQLNVLWPQEKQDWQLPPLLLIILVENTFKHGIENQPSSSPVSIQFTIKSLQLTMQCTNAYVAKNEHHISGMGLTNLRRRLGLLFADKFSLSSSIDQNQTQWKTTLTLELQP